MNNETANQRAVSIATRDRLAGPVLGFERQYFVTEYARMDQTRRIRFLVGGLLVVVIGLVGSLMAIPLLIREPLQVVRPGATDLLASADRGAPATVQIRIGGSGDFLLLSEAPKDGALPTVRFGMPNHDMPPVRAEVELVEAGLFQASGRLEMPGRWRLIIEYGDKGAEFDFMLAEF